MRSLKTTLRAIVFDFDGVILESADIKTRAFLELFKDYPEHLDKILKLHLDNVGISRFEKFKIICRDYLGRPSDNSALEYLSELFTQLVYVEILRCPFVPGAYEFLKKHFSIYDLFIASGTPEREVRDIVRERRLDAFFRLVYGSPRSKGEILRDILLQNGLQPEQLIFCGDALSDYFGAREASVPFIGRVPPGASNPFPADGVVAIVQDLQQLDAQWPGVVEDPFGV